MRWGNAKPALGSCRTVKRFLFLPVTLDGVTAWLETAYIEQRYLFRADHSDELCWRHWNWSTKEAHEATQTDN